MQRILINDPGQLELLKTHDRIEVCDNEGNPIGYFVTCFEHDPKLYEWAQSQLSDEELLRRRNARGNGRTTDEVINRLEAE